MGEETPSRLAVQTLFVRKGDEHILRKLLVTCTVGHGAEVKRTLSGKALPASQAY